MGRLTRGVAAGGAAAILVALAGCSTPNAAPAPQPRTHATSVAPSSGATSTTSNAASAPRARTVAALGAAVLHNTEHTSSVHVGMTMQVPGVGIVTASGVARFTGTRTAERLTMTIPNVGQTQVILVGGTVYVNAPGGAGKPWVRAGGSGPAQSLARTAILAGQADPTHLLQHVESAGTIVSATQETLDGVATTHYAITVDRAKLAKAYPAERRALNRLGMTSLPFAIWVNSENLPVRVVTVVPVSTPGVTAGRQFSITVDYSHWGAPVTITAPPANEVAANG